jgi:cellulose synthase/poly-beta-1,6-N-acetylglucosamine synthase-like glycosyltransferase
MDIGILTISFWTFFGITLFIDVFTLVFFYFKKDKTNGKFSLDRTISVLIPIHKEESSAVIETIESIYSEHITCERVIICGDSDTSKETKSIIRRIEKDYSNLSYVESPHKSKAMKINFIANSFLDLGNFLYIRDCRVRGEKDAILKMLSKFTNKNIAAVTSHGWLHKPKNFLAKAYFFGKEWINEIGRFRKIAQEKRKAIFVICGASTIFRLDILRKIPVPATTKTEDTHYTWVLQLNGYEIKVANDAIVSAPDVDGEKFSGIKNQIKQVARWYSGTIQCLYREGKNLPKNKMLLYSTITPGTIEALMYTIPLVFLPLLFFININLAVGFLIGDAVFSLASTLIIMPRKMIKTIVHYPEIFFFKYLNACVFLYAIISVSLQKFTGRTDRWSNEWDTLPAIKLKIIQEFSKEEQEIIIPEAPKQHLE